MTSLKQKITLNRFGQLPKGDADILLIENEVCGFRKAHSTQYVLFRLITSLEKELDNSDLVGTIPLKSI